jgi:hypothetical protein
MKTIRNLIILSITLFSVAVGSKGFAETTFKISDLELFKTAGQIHGHVESCSNKYNPQGTIVHVPGISISTRLGPSGEFLLLSVPQGNHRVMFEGTNRIYGSLESVNVQPQKRTEVGNIRLCPDMDGDGYNLLADLDDTHPGVYPGAKEICDRKDNNGNGEIDEGCSYRKCPKGGNFCLQNWNNINPKYRPGSSSKIDEPASNRETAIFQARNNRLSTGVR